MLNVPPAVGPPPTRPQSVADLTRRQRLFLKYCCYPPPRGRGTIKPNVHLTGERDYLGVLRHYFGSRFEDAIKGKVVLDYGCGGGLEVLACVDAGAVFAMGYDVEDFTAEATAKAQLRNMSDRVQFAINQPLPRRPDVIFSQNSVEHYEHPERVFQEWADWLSPGKLAFVTFGPPWYHPFGCHHFRIVKYPWPHLYIGERDFLRVASLYDGHAMITRWEQAQLNRMTLSRFFRGVTAGGAFAISFTHVRPISGVPPLLTKIPGVREFITSHVSVILTRR